MRDLLTFIAILGLVSLAISLPAFGDLNQSDAKAPSPMELRELYREVSSFDGQYAYRALDAKSKTDLWALHLFRALDEIPDLTEEESAVIYHGIGLLASGVLDDSDNEKPKSVRHESLKLLEQRAKEVFEPNRGRAIFSQLGSGVIWDGEVIALIDACTCSTESDWCDWLTNPDPNCREVLCEETKSGCGTFWVYPCNGICG